MIAAEDLFPLTPTNDKKNTLRPWHIALERLDMCSDLMTPFEPESPISPDPMSGTSLYDWEERFPSSRDADAVESSDRQWKQESIMPGFALCGQVVEMEQECPQPGLLRICSDVSSQPQERRNRSLEMSQPSLCRMSSSVSSEPLEPSGSKSTNPNNPEDLPFSNAAARRHARILKRRESRMKNDGTASLTRRSKSKKTPQEIKEKLERRLVRNREAAMKSRKNQRVRMNALQEETSRRSKEVDELVDENIRLLRALHLLSQFDGQGEAPGSCLFETAESQPASEISPGQKAQEPLTQALAFLMELVLVDEEKIANQATPLFGPGDSSLYLSHNGPCNT